MVEKRPGGVTDSAKNAFSPHAGKGGVARASLYFLLRYPDEVASSNGDFPDFYLPLMLQWHREEPPTDHERHRNFEIQQRQGNRNPLIDYPDLAPKVVEQLQPIIGSLAQASKTAVTASFTWSETSTPFPSKPPTATQGTPSPRHRKTA